MSGNNKAAMLRADNAATRDDKAAPPSPASNNAVEEHRGRMSRGEILHCLRDVHRYWSTPRISSGEMEALEQQNLIQRNTTAICAIRLTEDGARFKNLPPLKMPRAE